MLRKHKIFLPLLSLIIGGLVACNPAPTPDPDPDPDPDPTPVVVDKVKLTGPENDSTHEILDGSYLEYLNAKTEVEQIAALDKYKKANPSFKSIKLTWDGDGSSFYNVFLATSGDFSNPTTYRISGLTPYLDLDNLVPGTTYYWKVAGNKPNDTSEIRTFKTDSSSTLRVVNASGGFNIRDFGGWKINDNQKVRYGMIYRGNCLNGFQNMGLLTEEGKETFNNQLGIKTELDLRKVNGDDGNQTKNYFDENKPYVKATLDQYTNILDSETWAAVKNGEKPIQVSGERPSGGSRGSLQKIFDLLSDTNNYPIYAHCNAGADRTGTLAFLVNGLLGVSYEDLIKDFELTTYSKSGERYRSKIVENGEVKSFDKDGVYMTSDKGNFVAFDALYQVITKYYEASSLSKSIERFLTEYVNIPSSTIEKVKTILIEGYTPKNPDYTVSGEPQNLVVADENKHAVKLGDVKYDSVTSVLLGDKELGTDLDKLDIGTLDSKICGDHTLLVTAKQGSKDILISVPVKIITKEINDLDSLIAIVDYKTNDKPATYGYYTLTNDIGADTSELSNGGFPTAPSGITYYTYHDCYGFQGVLDGNGHTIIGKTGSNGLFFTVGGSALLKNVKFDIYGYADSYKVAHKSVLAQTIDGATFDNVTFNVKEGPNGKDIVENDWCGLISSAYVKNNIFNNLKIDATGFSIASVFGGTGNGFVNNNKYNGLEVKADYVKELGHDSVAKTTAYLSDIYFDGEVGDVCKESNEYNMKDTYVNLYLGKYFEEFKIESVSFKDNLIKKYSVSDGEINFKNENIIKDIDAGNKSFYVEAISPDDKLTYNLEVPVNIISSYEQKELLKVTKIDLSDSSTFKVDLEGYADYKNYVEQITYKGSYNLGTNVDSLDTSGLTDYKTFGPDKISIFINDGQGHKYELVGDAVAATKIIKTFEEFNKGVLSYNKDISQSAVATKIYGYYYLDNDIGNESTSYSCWLGDYWSVGSSAFCGVFDGGGNTVKGCSSKVVSGQRGVGGFFGAIGEGAIIKNTTFEDYQYYDKNSKTHIWDTDPLTLKNQAVLGGIIDGATLENLTFILKSNLTDATTFAQYSADGGETTYGLNQQCGWLSAYAAQNTTMNDITIEAEGKYIGSIFGGNCNPQATNKYSNCVFTAKDIKCLAHSGSGFMFESWKTYLGITFIEK